MGFDANFKFRLPRSVYRRAERVRRLRGRSKSDFGRSALVTFVEKEERELGIVPEVKS